MRCCICGKTIEDYGNNPYPLCEKEDNESRCCDECNDLVVHARVLQLKYGSVNQRIIPNKSNIFILYSKNSDIPLNTFKDNGSPITGIVLEENKNELKGTWGNFVVNIDTDTFFVTLDK